MSYDTELKIFGFVLFFILVVLYVYLMCFWLKPLFWQLKEIKHTKKQKRKK